VLLEENTYLRKRLEAHVGDVERAEKRLQALEGVRSQQDEKYHELMERYRQIQAQVMACECG
jgi:predicted nuclease with TOPRIM domain